LEKLPWKGNKWWVSHLNYSDEVISKMNLPEQVTFHDVTLRDGEQTPGIVLREEEKVRIARELDTIGVGRIEAGMPVVSDAEKKTVKKIANSGLNAKIMALCRLVKSDIDTALDCDVWGVVLEGPVGYPKLQYQFGWSEEEVINRALESIDYAKTHGLHVVFFGVDTTRSDLEFLTRIFKAAVEEAHADGIAVVDTYSAVTPLTMDYLIRSLKSHLEVPLEVHCHNDLGMATANTLAAVGAGAQVVHVTVNGIGERSGNAALEEVAIDLLLFFGMNTGLHFEKFYQLSKLVQELTNFKMPTNKPLVGNNAFARESGIGVAGWVKYQLGSQAILPELVGNVNKIFLGKKSGRVETKGAGDKCVRRADKKDPRGC